MARENFMKTSGIERTYVLGSYKNLKVIDFISKIPANIFLNKDAMEALMRLQWSRLDMLYYDYLKNSPTFKEGLTAEEAMVMLEEVRETSFEQLMKATASTAEKEPVGEEEQEENEYPITEGEI